MKKLIIILIIAVYVHHIDAQFCGTPATSSSPASTSSLKKIRSQGCPAIASSVRVYVNVYFHIIRQTNGSNAFTPPNVDNIVRYLNRFYQPHNITIRKAGMGFINNSDFVLTDHNKGRRMAGSYNKFNAINYYIVWGIIGRSGGFTLEVPSRSLFISHKYVLTSVSPHELGHCLNLYHTHRHSPIERTATGCVELTPPTRPNCTVCGDMVCDTPADQGKGHKGGYTPDLTNIMSYYLPADHFTAGQGQRMREAIACNPMLKRTACIESRRLHLAITPLGSSPTSVYRISVSGGSPPYKYYLNSKLVYETAATTRTMRVSCNGGSIKVWGQGSCAGISASGTAPYLCGSTSSGNSLSGRYTGPNKYHDPYPNPTSSVLNIAENNETPHPLSAVNASAYSQTATYELIDSQMETVSRGNMTALTTIDVSGFTPGRYILRIRTAKGTETHQILIE